MGRPKGSNNVKPVTVAEKSRCPSCGATESSRIGNRQVQVYSGLIDGKPFTHIVRQRVLCDFCPQMRIEKTYENHPEGMEDDDQ